MDLRKNAEQKMSLATAQTESHSAGNDGWWSEAAVLDGPRRTYFLLLERLEQSRAVLRDLSARLHTEK